MASVLKSIRARMARVLGRVRRADEFAPARVIRAPRKRSPTTSWSLEQIRAARDAQMHGQFAEPVRLAEAMRTDDAMYVAYNARIAPISSVASKLVPQQSERGKVVEKRIRSLAIVSRSVVKGICGTLANHGVAIGHVERTTDDEGTATTFTLTEWPLEHVRWDESRETLMTRIRDAADEPITHGDGEWVVFRKFRDKPWTQEAAVLPASFVWAAHMNGISDWAAASLSHGLAKILGEMPQGFAIQAEDGEDLTDEAEGFLDTIQDLAAGDSNAGIIPNGAKATFLANGSTAWQVFSELITNREKAAARIYTGTDAILGSTGGAPGVDISALFRLASTAIQSDFQTIEDGLNTGLYQPCTAINCGDSRYAPSYKFDFPDPDQEQRSRDQAAKRDRLFATLEKYRSGQMTVDQGVVDQLAGEYGVEPPPQLAPVETARIPLELAPTDVARVTRVDEARASQGLPALGDERGALFVSELEALAKAKGEALTPAPPPA